MCKGQRTTFENLCYPSTMNAGGRTKVNRLEQQNKCFYSRNFPILLLKTGLLLKLEFTELARAAGRQAPKDPPVSAP